jgi:exo-beta-1,3-glucanase (GH17 family)
MIKKLFALLMAILIATTVFTTISIASDPIEFSDISGHWAKSYITDLLGKGIVNGYQVAPDVFEFRPNNPIQRQEFAKILTVAYGVYNTLATSTFSDCPSGSWFTPYVGSLEAEGLTTGLGDEKFGVGYNMSRQDTAVMLSRAMIKYQAVILPSPEEALTAVSIFSDTANIAEYAKQSVAFFVQAGIVKGYETYIGSGVFEFRPKENIMRAEISKIISMALEYTFPIPAPEPAPTPKKIYGLNFSPYVIDGQNPDLGTQVSETQMNSLIDTIAPYTQWIRTFTSADDLQVIGRIAHEHGLKVAAGAWLGKENTPAKIAANQEQINALITVGQAGQADMLIVGSEVLYRNELSEAQLTAYIKQVKMSVPNVIVTTADVYTEILKHPSIISSCDIVLSNFYPYWEGISVDRATLSMRQKYQQIVAIAQGKQVLISETGWPSVGDTVGKAVASPENSAFFFKNFVSWVQADNIPYFYFEAFDEPWKALKEGPQGASWGIWNKDSVMKFGMQDVFDGKTVSDNWS